MKRFIHIIAMLGLAGAVLSACGQKESSNANADAKDDKTLSIYTTLYPLQYFTEQIGGANVEVKSILPAGADAHTYEPTSKTIVDIAEADAFIFHTEEMETYASTIKEALDDNVKTLEAAEGVSLLEHEHGHEEETVEEGTHNHSEDSHSEEEEHDHSEEEHSHDHGDQDPHVWLDPIRSIALAENIKDTLVDLNPEAKQEFEKNFENLKERLEVLDKEFHEKLENQERKEILVTHAAYGYWEEVYGIKQIAISGLSPSNEPSQQQLEDIIDTVTEHDIQYLLFEQNVEPNVAKIIQKEADLESLNIHNLEVLTEEDIENKENYFTIMSQNLDVLVEALEE
ncbi:zinc ABC transporter substrate-binding protein [Radiobacillus kanasensis]|uniref:metal ABC transporter solute-binding protein, Zn/Mn family n=1 Tax=Radiobacillus kanasensis TaxID=2844358 RepID=UPI001E34A769|nr:zinc ABC transporter substrate-binding protein [Radiobacillus kanasensis]UFT98377.1 zinc ABC transporter substrate-binding protein [Radiobacillus kanasensis]